MEELSYVLTKDFFPVFMFAFIFSLPLIFTSHFFTAAMKFSCFSSNNFRHPSSFSVIHVRVNIKNNVEKDTTSLVFFSLKVRAAMRFFSVAFGLPYLLIELFYIGVPVVRTDGRSVGRGAVPVTWLPIFLGWVDLLSYGAPHARASRSFYYYYYY